MDVFHNRLWCQVSDRASLRAAEQTLLYLASTACPSRSCQSVVNIFCKRTAVLTCYQTALCSVSTGPTLPQQFAAAFNVPSAASCCVQGQSTCEAHLGNLCTNSRAAEGAGDWLDDNEHMLSQLVQQRAIRTQQRIHICALPAGQAQWPL